MIVLATIPVGLTGLLLEHTFRTTLGRPVPAAIFLVVNGLVLLIGERVRRRAAPTPPPPGHGGVATLPAEDLRLSRMRLGTATVIGSAQILALLPGISRSGVAMIAGLSKGLTHEDAARFSFLLATPVILAAGVLKVPDLFGPLGAGIHGQVLAGSVAAFVCAYLAVRFLTRWFETRTLLPFGLYCLAAGLVALILVG